jgi:7,8-dihydroneopterin aldolase/epimerase/oxygenase
MADEVFLEGMRFYAYHGHNPEEQIQGQRFVVDVRISADVREAGQTDDLTKTVNYSQVFRRVREIVEGPPRSLIEAVAEEISAVVLRDFVEVQSVSVTVRKPEVAIKGSILDAAGVTITRYRASGELSSG